MTIPSSNGCNVCQKKGFPIFVSRFAVGTSSTPDSPIQPDGYPTLSGPGKYTLRNLRAGYLYVFDDLDKQLTGYRITPDGFLARIALNLPEAQATAQSLHKPCFNVPERVGNAALLTVPKPEVSRKIYLAFSDHLWTPRVCQLHIANPQQRTHMTPVQVGSASKTSTSIQNLPKVCEYLLNASQGKKEFGWSVWPFYLLATKTKAVIAESERLAPGKGVIVAINDPIGIMTDIKELTAYYRKAFENKPDYVRKIHTDNLLTALEYAIKDQKLYENIDNEDASNKELERLNKELARRGMAPSPMKPNEAIATHNTDTSMKSAWADYSKKIVHDERKGFRAAYLAAFKSYDTKYLLPLSKAYVEWLKSPITAKYFKLSYDNTNAVCGVKYSQTVAAILGNMCDYLPVLDYITKVLNSPKIDDDDFITRALLLNQQKLVEKVNASPFKDFNMVRDIAWDALLGAFVAATEKAREQGAQVVDHLGGLLSYNLSPAFIRLMESALTQKHVAAGIVGFGMLIQRKFTVITVAGGRPAMIEAILTEMAIRADSKMALPRLRSTIKRRISLLQKESGLVLNGSVSKKMLCIEWEGIKAANTLGELKLNINTYEDLAFLRQARFKQAVSNAANQRVQSSAATGVIVRHMGLGASVFAGILQAWVLTKLFDDATNTNNMKHEATELKMRFYAGIGALVATIGQTIELALGKIPERSLGSIGKLIKTNAGRLARWLGPIAGFTVMVLDGRRTYQEYSEKNFAISGLFLLSTIAGLGAIGIPFMLGTSAFAGWLLLLCVGVLIITAVLLTILVDNALQDWIERSAFGTYKEGRYKSLSEEKSEFEKAMAKMTS